MNTVGEISDIKARIHDIYEELLKCDSLAPQESVNNLFNELVKYTHLESPSVIREVLGDAKTIEIQEKLQNIYSRGGFFSEKFWAERVLAAPSKEAFDIMSLFPKFENYKKLTRLEANGMFAVKSNFIKRMLFIGSGPLPLSSILFVRDHDLYIDNLDRSQEACELGGRLAKHLGISERLGFIQGECQNFVPDEPYDAIVLAAMVGKNKDDKLKMLEHFASFMTPGSLLLLRTARDLKKLIYPPVEATELKHFKPLIETHSYHGVINSVIIAQKEPPEIAVE